MLLAVRAAVLVTATFPVALPATVGANSTIKLAYCPAAIVNGTAKPCALNPAPLVFIPWTVTAVLPWLTSLTPIVDGRPIVTCPKATEDVLGANNSVAETPAPPSHSLRMVFVALLLMVRVPFTLATCVGAKRNVKAEEWPGAILSGRLSP